MKRVLVGLILVSLFITGQALAQGFGKNKVQYENFDWQFIQSEHFDVYFTKGGDQIAEFCAETAEQALVDIEDSWNYKLEGRITIVVYRSHNNFQQTNVTLSMTEESVGGFTEFLKNRVVLPFTGNYEAFRHVIHHELTHAVNMRMFYGSGFQSILVGVSTSNIPLWFTEGIAEYESRGGWDVEADMFMRDATLNGYLPPMNYLGGYFAYKGGQSVFYYLDRKYGREKVGEFVNKVKNTRDIERAVESTLGLEMEEFDRQWQTWLRKLYFPTVADLKAPTDFAERLTDHSEWHNYVNNGGAISPDGMKVVYLSDRTEYFDIWLYDLDKEAHTRLLRGERSGDFEQLKWLDARISWSPDGKHVAFASKAGRYDAVNILNVEKKDIVEKLHFEMDGIFNPSWSPDSSKIAFVGLTAGQSDLYYYELNSKQLVRVTNDVFSDDDPTWTRDSKSLVFTSDRQDSVRVKDYVDPSTFWQLPYRQMDIYSIALGDSAAQRLTFTPTDERTPTLTPNGEFLIYASSANGIFNLYRQELASGTVEPITNVLTGCLQPNYSMNTQRLLFTSFYNGGYDVYLVKNAQEMPAVELQPTNFRLRGTPEPRPADTDSMVQGESMEIQERSRPYSQYIFAQSGGVEDPSEIQNRAMADTATTREPGGGFRSKRYKTRFTPDFVYATAAYSSFFGAQGTGQILFSDVLGNQLIFINTDLYYDFNNLENTNFSAQYFYLPRRLNYGVGLFRYVYYLDGGHLQDQTMQLDLNVAYPFSKFSRAEFNVSGFAIDRARWRDYPEQNYVPTSFRRVVLPELAYVHDTVLWGITGPVNGSRWRLSYAYSPMLGENGEVNKPFAEFYTAKGDVREYVRLGRDYSWAARMTAGLSGGPDPQRFFLGGVTNWINRSYENNEIPEDIDDFYFSSFVTPYRGGDYFEKRGTGNRFFLMNQEFRFPLIQYLIMKFPLPIGLANVRGAFFTDIGAAWFDDEFKLTYLDEKNHRRLADPQVAYGMGIRSHLGFFILRWDMAWSTDGVDNTKPRYYFSIGSEY